MFNILENLFDSTLKLENLLYKISKIKQIDPVLKEEFKKYETEFIKIRGNYFELFKEIDEDFEEEELNIKGTKKFCEEFIQTHSKEEVKNLLEIIYNLSKISLKIIQINELKKEKKETLTALKNKSLNIQDNIIIQSDSATNTNSAAEVPITVDDTDALKELQELIHFSYDLGYNLKLYYELYQKGEIEKELKNSNHTDSEIKFTKKYLKEKGPVLVKRRNY